jgi:CheY-like chemotaxis protein
MNDETLGGSREGMSGEVQPQPQKRSPKLPGAPKSEAPIGTADVGSMGLGKKTVLLVDSNWPSRESRAKVMRERGVHVDCVSNVAAARGRLAVETYNLILVDPGRNVSAAEMLVQEIRTRNARQLVRFLVGSPLFIATSLSGHKPRPQPAIVSPENPGTPVTNSIDFGQKIRDVEAEETADEDRGTQDAAGR